MFLLGQAAALQVLRIGTTCIANSCCAQPLCRWKLVLQCIKKQGQGSQRPILPAVLFISFRHQVLLRHDEHTNNWYTALFTLLNSVCFFPRCFRAALTFRTAIKAVFFPSAAISPVRKKEMKENYDQVILMAAATSVTAICRRG